MVYVKEFWAAARHYPGAKNVKGAPVSPPEARRIIEEMPKFADVKALVERHLRRIEAGLRIFEAGYAINSPFFLFEELSCSGDGVTKNTGIFVANHVRPVLAEFPAQVPS